MVTLKEFIENPIDAMSRGYKASYIDHCAMWCNYFSYDSAVQVVKHFRVAFAKASIIQFPVYFLKACLSLFMLTSLPLTVWVLALYSKTSFKSASEHYRKELERIHNELSG